MNQKRIRQAFVAMLFVLGCSQKGPPLAPVTGVVTLDGKPLEEATVVFQPSGKQASPSAAETSSDGEFELSFGRDRKGAMIGKHKVRITTERVITDEGGKETAVAEKIPPKYNKHTTLQLEVIPGINEFEIELDSKMPAPQTQNQTSNGCP